MRTIRMTTSLSRLVAITTALLAGSLVFGDIDLPQGMSHVADELEVRRLSMDGRRVVGYVVEGGDCYAATWSPDAGLRVLPRVGGDVPIESEGMWMHSDGTVYGVAWESGSLLSRGIAMWPSDGGDPTIIPGTRMRDAYGLRIIRVSEDRQTIVASVQEVDGFGNRAFRWTSTRGIEFLEHSQGVEREVTIGWASNRDGSVVAGAEGRGPGFPAPVAWIGGDRVALSLDDGQLGRAVAMSADGDVIVGRRHHPDAPLAGQEAWRWTQHSGIQILPDMTAVSTITGDGANVIGVRWDACGGCWPPVRVVWTEATGTVPFLVWASAQGFMLPEAFDGGEAEWIFDRISQDGRSLLLSLDFDRGDCSDFIRVLYRLGGSCGGDLDGDDRVGLADLLLVLDGWGTAAGDVDGDGSTNGSDVQAVIEQWGDCAVGEP